ncbi:hypothetical protein DFJ73DRAFT_870593 [Zopfochytrium polystomum]|nr:hypothetical protein DFJ73DRAFT_870593 [Zopfochytrium polystomum]
MGKFCAQLEFSLSFLPLSLSLPLCLSVSLPLVRPKLNPCCLALSPALPAYSLCDFVSFWFGGNFPLAFFSDGVGDLFHLLIAFHSRTRRPLKEGEKFIAVLKLECGKI